MSDTSNNGFVPAICTQCGAPLEVDPSLEAGVCIHCGTQFVTAQAINKYYVQNNIHIGDETYNIQHGKKGVAQSAFEFLDKRAAAIENAVARGAEARAKERASAAAKAEADAAWEKARAEEARETARIRAQEKAAKRASRKSYWSIVLGLVIVFGMFGAFNSKDSDSKSAVPTSAVTPQVSAPVAAGKEDTSQASKLWYEQEPIVLEKAAYSVETKHEELGTFGYDVPASWQRTLDVNKRYYRPYADTNNTFIMVSLDELNGTVNMSDETARIKLLSEYVDNITKAEGFSNCTAAPALLGERKGVAITATVASADKTINQNALIVCIPGENGLLSVAVTQGSQEKAVSGDDLSALLGSIGEIKPHDFSGVSIYPKSLHATLAQAAEPAPLISYNTPGEENGLIGSFFYVDGVVKDQFSFESNGFTYNNFVVSTEHGDVIVSNTYESYLNHAKEHIDEPGVRELIAYVEEPDSDYSFPSAGLEVRVFGVYQGYSEYYKMPAYYYGYPVRVLEFLSGRPGSNNQNIPSTGAPSPTPAPDVTPVSTPTPSPTPTPTPIPTPTPTPDKLDKSTILTEGNCPELAELINADYVDPTKQAAFLEKYSGYIIEFDAVVFYLEKDPRFKTMYNYVIVPGEDKTNFGATLFYLEHMNFGTFHWDRNTRPEYLEVGSKIRIQAVASSGSDSTYIYLNPKKTWGR